MLSVPTLWTAYVVNFLALGLVWAYVARSYPKFEAARFWTGSAFAAACGTALGILRMVGDSLLPLLAGGTVMISGLSFAGLAFFIFGDDSAPMRISIYSLGQCLPLALTLKLLLSRQ